MFKGIDRTYSAEMLSTIAKERYDGLTDEEKLTWFKLTEEFKEKIKEDWLLNLLCQYKDKGCYNFNFGDVLWYRDIKEMILSGNLYMSIFKLPNYAFKDLDFEKNVDNIGCLGVTVTTENKGNSDGIWEMNAPLTLSKIYPTDDFPDKPEQIVMNNPHGIVEFGTQKICKTAASLKMNDILLRVPYKTDLDYIPPIGAFFLYTAQ